MDRIRFKSGGRPASKKLPGADRDGTFENVLSKRGENRA